MNVTNAKARKGKPNSLARASALVLAPVLALAAACGSDASAEPDVQTSPDTAVSPSPDYTPEPTSSPSPDYTPDIEPTTSDDVAEPDLLHEALHTISMGMTLDQVIVIIGLEPANRNPMIYGNVTVASYRWPYRGTAINGAIVVDVTDSGEVLRIEVSTTTSLHRLPATPSVDVTDLGITTQARQALYIGMTIEEAEAVIGFPADSQSPANLIGHGNLAEIFHWRDCSDCESPLYFWRDNPDFWFENIDPYIAVTVLDGLVVGIEATV